MLATIAGDGAHCVTILQDHQNDGSVGGRDVAALCGLVNGLDRHVGCVWPAAHRLGIRVRENQTGGREFLIHLDVLGTLGEAAGVS